MANFLDGCIFTPVSVGTGDFVVSAAVQGYMTPAVAGAVNGQIYRYRAESADLSQWEIGYGVYTSGTVTLARTVVLYNSLGTTAKINFTAAPNVGIVPLSMDLIGVDQANAFTAVQQQQARRNIGASAADRPPCGRITLQAATPVMTTAQLGKVLIVWSPTGGGQVPFYDGTNWYTKIVGEFSSAISDTTKNPAAIGASKVNDWFLWDDAGVTRLSHGPDWTSDTARSAGTALVVVDGILMNSVAITNGPGASRGVFVGTTRSNASSTLDWQPGGAAAGGTAALLNVWNMYNRVQVSSMVVDTTVTYSYTSATVRAVNGSTANRINFVSGLAEEGIVANGNHRAQLVASGAAAFYGFALDSVTAFDRQASVLAVPPAQGSFSPTGIYAPQLGYHFIQALEAGDGVNANTFVANTVNQNLNATFRM